jgi:hypothetical protein
MHAPRQLEAVRLLEADIHVVVQFLFMHLTRAVCRELQMVLPAASVRNPQTVISRISEALSIV